MPTACTAYIAVLPGRHKYRPLLETRRKALEMCAEVKQKRNDGASTEAHLLATRKTLVVVEVLLHGPCDMHRACRMVRQPQFNLLPVKSAPTWEAEQLLRPTQRVKAYSTPSHSIRQVPRAQEKTMQLTHHARKHPVTVGVQTTSRRGGRPRGVEPRVLVSVFNTQASRGWWSRSDGPA